MLSNFDKQGIENSIDNAFQGIPILKKEQVFIKEFLTTQDYSPHTIRAMIFDLKKFLHYFTTLNNESFDTSRVTVMDLSGFKRDLREKKKQAVATVNRAIVSIRKYLDWIADKGEIESNPAKAVKEYKRQRLVPKGLDRSQVRKLFREIELRGDIRGNAIYSLLFHTGCRVSDLIQIALEDLIIGERSGSVIFRNGKRGKERTVPLNLNARKAIQDYLNVRPPVQTDLLFVGERGALTDIGIRSLCNKYSAICGFKIYPHLCRHTFAKAYLQSTNNDIVGLAQILGHQDLNTCRIYSLKNMSQISEETEKVIY